MMKINTFQKVLMLAPHTDDEFGCAATLKKLVNYGCEVKYIAFSACEESVPKGLPKDILYKECMAATNRIGIKKENVEILNFKVRHFPNNRQEILEKMVQLNKVYCPNLVLLPCSQDSHQDHHTIYKEGFRAFKHCTILGYELPQNLNTFSHTAYIIIDENELREKIEAMKSYKSQDHRNYSRENFIRGLSVVRGVQCGGEFAEAFEVIRMIMT